MKKVWIDFSNSPHILFFSPIIQKFEQDKIPYLITIRDFAQTEELANLFNLNFIKIGEHSNKKNFFKIFNIMKRAYKLRAWAKRKNICLALNHSSYAQIIAAKSLKIPVVTLMDYEYQPANHIGFRFSDYLFVPDCFSNNVLKKYGSDLNKVYKYKGIKEELYLRNFQPQQNFLEIVYQSLDSNLSYKEFKNKVIITVRTPATMSAYHQFDNLLFDRLIEYISQLENTVIIYLPRTIEQKEKIIFNRLSNVFCPKKILEGKNLIYNSDIVISAGGTMNREAAVLGTPAYTIFAGKMGSVDKELIKKSLLFEITSESDFEKILIRKKPYKKPEHSISYDLLDDIYLKIMEIKNNIH